MKKLINLILFIKYSIKLSILKKRLIVYSEINQNTNKINLFSKYFFEILGFFFAIYIFLMTVNIFLHFKSNDLINQRLERIENIELDRRHPYLVLNEMNKEKFTIQAQHPVIYLYRSEDYENNFFPLSGISNVNTLMCNENGYWKTTFTDKYGFNNKISNYDNLKLNIEDNILIIGDSSSEGYCVEDKYLPKQQLENEGYNVINLSKGGNGPLIELASLKEYIGLGEFNLVIWMYYPNDLNDLLIEKKDENLIKYLNDENYLQNIIYKQNIVDEFYKAKSDGYNQYFQFIDEKDLNKLEKKFNKLEEIDYFTEKLHLTKLNYFDLLFLKALIVDLRSRIKYLFMKNSIKETYPLLEKVLTNANNLIKEKNSKMLFVYLPSRIEILNKSKADQEVIKIIKRNGIDFLDLNELISGKYEYEDAYSFGLDDVHYNDKIYNLISNNVVSKVSEIFDSKD